MPHATSKTVNDTTIPVAPLETISYASLLAEDTQAKEQLLKACQHPGFFYLDFEDDDPKGESRQIAKDLREAYTVSEQYFTKHCPEDKMKDIEIRHDHIVNEKQQQPPPNLPTEMSDSLPLLTRLSNNLRAANVHMVNQLYPSLITNNHNPFGSSETALDLIYAPTKPLLSQAPDTTHTDGGTITILCSDSWGIQIEDPQSKEWAFAEPKKGCGLVNVANWLDVESKKVDPASKLHSCRHAVSQVGDGVVKRYYVVHYLRPEGVAC